MELITRMDAQKGTTEMLLDNFMNGFIHRLFEKKWRLYGARVHYAKRCADAALLVLVVYFSFTLKFDASSSSPAARGLAVAILAVAALIVAEEGRTAVLFAANEQGVGDAPPPRELLRLVLSSSASTPSTSTGWHALHRRRVRGPPLRAAVGPRAAGVAALVHANGTITPPTTAAATTVAWGGGSCAAAAATRSSASTRTQSCGTRRRGRASGCCSRSASSC